MNHHLTWDYSCYEGKTQGLSKGDSNGGGGLTWSLVKGGGRENRPEQVTTELRGTG